MKLDPYFTPFVRINSKHIRDLTVKYEIIQVVEENMEYYIATWNTTKNKKRLIRTEKGWLSGHWYVWKKAKCKQVYIMKEGEIRKCTHICLFLETKQSRKDKPETNKISYLQRVGRNQVEEWGGKSHFSKYNFLYSFDFWNPVNALHIQKMK